MSMNCFKFALMLCQFNSIQNKTEPDLKKNCLDHLEVFHYQLSYIIIFQKVFKISALTF